MTKKTNRFRKNRRRRENGQAALFLMLGLGLFLLGAMGFAVDMANLWMHRQSSQNAADAACTAAATDMVNDANGATNSGGFTAGTAFNCSGNSTFAPCQYAGFNGYTATGLTAGAPSTEVAVSFPSSVPGVQDCSATPTPAVCTSAGFPANAFVRVTVTDRIQSFFVGLFSGGTTMDVGATATCGAVLSDAPIPLLILDPKNESSVTANGNWGVAIYGGPQRSIQVNSPSSTAINMAGTSGVFDLSQGGKDHTGSDLGVTGTESATNFNGGTTGNWLSPKPAISDPFQLLPVPLKPPAGTTSSVPTGTNGCPAGPCTEYTAGSYPGIIVKNSTAIFDPGLYYLDGDFTADSNSCLRPSTLAGDLTGGEIFYFHTGTLNIDDNSGHIAPQGCPSGAGIATLVGSGTGQLKNGVKCTSSSDVPGNLPATITGNLLMGPCSGPYGDPLGLSDPIGEQHGIVFFGNRDTAGAAPSFGGGGTGAVLGSLYFHYCNSSDNTATVKGLGSNCNSSTGYTDVLTLGGGSGSTSYVVGDMVTDKLTTHGNPNINMDLNPNALYYVLKASLLQ
jgi:Flp pilus assembly protein TadG